MKRSTGPSAACWKGHKRTSANTSVHFNVRGTCTFTLRPERRRFKCPFELSAYAIDPLNMGHGELLFEIIQIIHFSEIFEDFSTWSTTVFLSNVVVAILCPYTFNNVQLALPDSSLLIKNVIWASISKFLWFQNICCLNSWDTAFSSILTTWCAVSMNSLAASVHLGLRQMFA